MTVFMPRSPRKILEHYAAELALLRQGEDMGALSNYPPGVTGHEPEIAGYAEGMVQATCTGMLDALNVRIFFTANDTIIDHQARCLADHGVDEIDCNWSGRLDVQYVGEEAVGTCPRCGGEIRIYLGED